MARSYPHAITNENTNYSVPPSTLAAQIIQNQTRPAVSRQSEQQSLFASLLHEILHNSSIEVENNVETNVQLIKVLVEAGLSILSDDQPFANDILIKRAKDSISVIESTIIRQPEVLTASITQDGPPVCLWLLARMVAVGGSSNADSLPLASLFRSLVDATRRSTSIWRTALTIESVLRDCAEDIVQCLERHTAESKLELILPPARSLSKLWFKTQGQIATSSECQSHMKDLTQPARLLLHMLASLSFPPVWQQDFSIRLVRAILKLRQYPRQTNTWDQILTLMLKHNLASMDTLVLYELAQLLTTASRLPIGLQQAMSVALRHSSRSSPAKRARVLMLEVLLKLHRSENFHFFDSDLKDTIISIVSSNCFTSGGPDRCAKGLIPRCGYRTGDIGIKRRKLSANHDHTTRDPSQADVYRYFSASETMNVEEFARHARRSYESMNESRQCEAWKHLARLLHLDVDTGTMTMLELAESLSLQHSRDARISAIQAIQVCVIRTTQAEALDLSSSILGKVCLRGLKSSSRDVRIAAGNCLPAFLKRASELQVCKENHRLALQWLREIADRDDLGVQETLVPTWGKVARILEDNELNLVLLRLVEYLGHPNPLIRGLAFCEVQSIAAERTNCTSVEALLQPYWSSIAVSVVQDLVSCPQKAQLLSELIGKDVDTFLTMTQLHTIPTMVLTKRKDVLRRIAASRSKSTTIRDLCIQPRANLIAVLSHLVAQGGQECEKMAVSCLTAVDETFTGEDFADFLKIDSTAIACELLNIAGEKNETTKSKARDAFQALALLCERIPNTRRNNMNPARAISSFFRRHILGMLTGFTALIEASAMSKTIREKTCCLYAVAEMIVLAKEEVSIALPQTRALLQSAIEQTSLCETAWETWLTLLPILEGDEIAMILEQTFALILKHWQSWSSQVQTKTHDMIGELIKKHGTVVTEHVMDLPSLDTIPLLAKFGNEINRMQMKESMETRFWVFTKRLGGENATVIFQALKDLIPYLEKHQSDIHDAAVSEQQSQYLSNLVRALLDVASTMGSNDAEPAELCGKALGIIGCLDPNRVDLSRKQERVLVLSNFDRADEVIGWVVVLLEQYLVKAFRSVTNAQAQGFMAYVIQELLKFCGFDQDVALRRGTQAGKVSKRWQDMPEHVQTTLTPFLSSRYTVTTSGSVSQVKRVYPAFSIGTSHSTWLRGLVYDLTWKAKGENARMLFPHLARIVRGHDLAIANFLLPYIILNIILGGTVTETNELKQEMLAVLSAEGESSVQLETVKLCSESLFGVLDYMSVWLREKRRVLTETRANAFRTGTSPGDFDEIKDMGQIETIEKFLAAIPAELIAERAMECGSYARALFNWEQYIRLSRPLILSSAESNGDEEDYHRLHEIYARIEEPDGLEGISEQLSFLSEEEQAIQHSKSGRWTAAQAWYEARLTNHPDNEALQSALLGCLKETGRFSALIKFAESFDSISATAQHEFLPLLVEAAWMNGDLQVVNHHLPAKQYAPNEPFSIAVGKLTMAANSNDQTNISHLLASLRRSTVLSMTAASTNSLQTCHDDLRKLHILSEVEIVNDALRKQAFTRELQQSLDKRLDVLGSHNADKQAILAIRRNLMRSNHDPVSTKYAASVWLKIARLARKEGNIEKAYHAVLRASELGDLAAKLEEAKLLWHDGHRRQAIAAIEQANASGIFDALEETQSNTMSSTEVDPRQNIVAAKAQLMHAKWLDQAGQTQSREMTQQYQGVTRTCRQWEKGHYHLGKHYFRMLEAERAMPKAKQNPLLLCGELSRLIIENLLRSIAFGNKYWYETVPKILTLWLDLGMEAHSKIPREDKEVTDKRNKALHSVNEHIHRYLKRFPPYIFYSALPQMLSRLSHPHPSVWRELSQIITNIVTTYPSQALWSLMAVTKATDKVRQDRGKEIMSKMRPLDNARYKTDLELRTLLISGQQLSNGLLLASEAAVEARATTVSLSRDLHFNMKLAPCQLVVPIETTLSVNLPPTSDHQRIRSYKPFVQDKVTIQAFQDNVMVLSSLQRPKKLTLRGSDGKLYGLLCKPKDDLRKDQRLMEFNGIINSAFKRDPAGSRRRLYIKTYAVTPLSEESGCLEWVEGIKPIRDILLNLYSRKGIRPNYAEIRGELNEACKSPDNVQYWEQIQNKFPATLHEWFTEVFPEPETWFAARLRYARSTAVMSMTGHVLGLGDRHGENILLQESTGGVFHVDFNCLFDKGLTFEKPELVPFRLTRNMVDAMGPYGHEGPFRKSSEVTLGLLRQNKDTLMTILETFLYDPTTDFVGKKKKSMPGVPDSPREILDGVEVKLRGLFRGETMPLSVEGYVDALIHEATSPWNLCQMYIGWCAFF